jgi:hypothetical protein
MFDGDGTNGGANNMYTDSSTNGFTVTETGSVVQGSFSPYGNNWSNYFDGTGDYITTPASSDFNYGTGDYCLEGWLNVSSDATLYSYWMAPISTGGDGNTETDAVSIYIGDGNSGSSVAGEVTVIACSNAFRLYGGTDIRGQWTHVAVTRESGTTRLFVNGQVTDSSTTSYNITNPADVGAYLGLTKDQGSYFKGHISNVRSVKGSAVYTSAFTPSTAPLTAISGTSLLTCQSNRFVDESTNNHTVTVNGDPEVTRFSPFESNKPYNITTDGGSGYFKDANDEHLSIAHQPEFLISGQQFTIEFWFYPLRSGVDDHVASYSNGTSDPNLNWLFRQINNDSFRFVVIQSNSSVRYIDSTSKIIANGWNHVVATGDGSSFIKMWLNGNYEGSASTDGTNQNNTSSASIKIAKWQNVNYKGYISDFRYVVGSQVYTGTSDITLPTSPLTAVTNTELLLNLQDSAIYDYSGLNNIDTVGNAQIDTAVKKYGTGSIEFDGTGDCLEISDTTFNSTLAPTGTEDFTIEAWININAHKNYNYIYSQGYPIQWVVTSTGVIQTYFNDTDDSTTYFTCHQTSGSALSTGTWYHVAITRDGASFRLFLDGVQVGSASVASSIAVTSLNPRIGDWALGGYSMNGYIDDFRITKGVARYTSNFTAPTAALPKF